MSVLKPPRPPMIRTALDLAIRWCDGRTVNGLPALRHALHVARTVELHAPHPTLDLIAAALVHDAPYLAPADVNLDAVLTNHLSPAVTRLVRALEYEHRTAEPNTTIDIDIDISQPDVLLLSAVDKFVSLATVIQRAQRTAHPSAFWSRRQPLLNRLPYLSAFACAAAPHLPAGLVGELHRVIALATDLTRTDPSA